MYILIMLRLIRQKPVDQFPTSDVVLAQNLLTNAHNVWRLTDEKIVELIEPLHGVELSNLQPFTDSLRRLLQVSPNGAAYALARDPEGAPPYRVSHWQTDSAVRLDMLDALFAAYANTPQLDPTPDPVSVPV